MAKYTQMGADDIRFLAHKYGLEVKDYSEIEGGAANSSFFLKANGNEYVLTIADDKPVEDVFNLASLLEHTADFGFPTSRLIRSEKGKKLTLFQEKAVMLKKYIPGTTIRHVPEEGLFSLGMILGHLHQIPVPDYIPQTHPYGASYFDNAYGLDFDAEFEDNLAQMEEQIKSEMPSRLPRGLIHADVFWDNVLFLNGDLQALIDFEDACNYFFVYDLASALFGTCIEAGKLNLDRASHIIKGYEQVRVMEENERRVLKLSTVYAGVAISYWRYLKYNVYNPSPGRKNLYKKTSAIAERINAIPSRKFNLIFI
jgi:homoserine kinase type II